LIKTRFVDLRGPNPIIDGRALRRPKPEEMTAARLGGVEVHYETVPQGEWRHVAIEGRLLAVRSGEPTTFDLDGAKVEFDGRQALTFNGQTLLMSGSAPSAVEAPEAFRDVSELVPTAGKPDFSSAEGEVLRNFAAALEQMPRILVFAPGTSIGNVYMEQTRYSETARILVPEKAADGSVDAAGIKGLLEEDPLADGAVRRWLELIFQDKRPIEELDVVWKVAAEAGRTDVVAGQVKELLIEPLAIIGRLVDAGLEESARERLTDLEALVERSPPGGREALESLLKPSQTAVKALELKRDANALKRSAIDKYHKLDDTLPVELAEMERIAKQLPDEAAAVVRDDVRDTRFAAVDVNVGKALDVWGSAHWQEYRTVVT
jgi:hypothetical protein